MRTHYSGRNSTPGYHCSGEHLVEGRGSYCLNIGGVQIDDAVARAFLAALEPATIAATLAAAEQLEMDREATLKHWRLGVERASYAASLAERRYRAVDPDNRLVARGLERAWEESLNAVETAKAELARRQNERPRILSSEERSRIGTLGPDLATVWKAATTMPRDRKELLGTLIEEVILKVERDKSAAHLTLRWKGGALPEIDLALPRKRQATVRTDEDTLDEEQAIPIRFSYLRTCALCTFEIDRAIRGVTPALSACRRPLHRRLSESEKPTVSPQRSLETREQVSRLFRRCGLFGWRFFGFGLFGMFIGGVQEPIDQPSAALLHDLRIFGLLLIIEEFVISLVAHGILHLRSALTIKQLRDTVYSFACFRDVGFGVTSK